MISKLLPKRPHLNFIGIEVVQLDTPQAPLVVKAESNMRTPPFVRIEPQISELPVPTMSKFIIIRSHAFGTELYSIRDVECLDKIIQGGIIRKE